MYNGARSAFSSESLPSSSIRPLCPVSSVSHDSSPFLIPGPFLSLPTPCAGPPPRVHRGLPPVPLSAELSLQTPSAVQPAGRHAPQPGAGPGAVRRGLAAKPGRERPGRRAPDQHLHRGPREGHPGRGGQAGQETDRHV